MGSDLASAARRATERMQNLKVGMMGIRRRLLGEPPDLSLDGSVPFRLDRDLLIPRQHGVYLIHDLRGVLYVGRSINLRRRFDEHFWECTNPLLARALACPIGELRFSWHLVDHPEQATYEQRLVNFFNPPCNRTLYVAHALAADRRRRAV